jgi:hypothetical protein
VIVVAVATLASCSITIRKDTGPLTYYVSQSGSDEASGTSPGTAWRTLSRVNSAALPPGTTVLLRGGDRFTGWLRLWKRDAGSAAKPVTIASYGTGAATIYAPDEPAITVFDTAGVDIRGLNLAGSRKADSGIKAYSDLPKGRRLRHISISGVQVHGFRNGISIGGKNDGAGFADIRVTDSVSYGNVDSGFLLFGPAFDAKSPAYANQDVLISRVVARGNLGDPSKKTTDSGNGIVLGSVSHGLVAWSTAVRNGGNGNAGEEGAGIWAYDSTGITITHNLSYENKTANKIDGDGFDLDENTSNCVVEDNLSYANDGAGFLIYSGNGYAAVRGDVIRNNISSDDVRAGNRAYGAITVIGYVNDLAVYQNTVVMARAVPTVRIGSTIHHVIIANNIFTARSGPIVRDDARALDAVTLRGNDYYSAGTWQLIWGRRTYRSLPAWQAATAQELRRGHSTGRALDPQLSGAGLGLTARSPADAAAAAAAAFQLAPGSPLSGAGLDLATLGLTADPANFLGQARPGRHPNIGAL